MERVLQTVGECGRGGGGRVRGSGTLCVHTNTSLLYTAQKVRGLNCTGVGDEVGSYRHVRV